jgi:hypothetical protein
VFLFAVNYDDRDSNDTHPFASTVMPVLKTFGSFGAQPRPTSTTDSNTQTVSPLTARDHISKLHKRVNAAIPTISPTARGFHAYSPTGRDEHGREELQNAMRDAKTLLRFEPECQAELPSLAGVMRRPLVGPHSPSDHRSEVVDPVASEVSRGEFALRIGMGQLI